jgi:hypothetical protein
MYIKPSRIPIIFVRYGVAIFLLLTIVGITVTEDFRNIRNPYSWDEHLYQNVSNNFTTDHIRYLENHVMESKPLPFLTLQKVLNSADQTTTRAFNFLLIIICTFLIYKITNNNKFAIFYILIPIFLDSMWLTAEIIEVTFVLLSIRYAERSGIFIGFSTIFRPSGILYTLLLKKKQMLYVIGIGTAYALLLIYLNLFNSYLFEVKNYAADGFMGIDLLVVVILVMFIIIGLNKTMLGYVIATALFFNVKMYPHYFIPIMTFLFVGFLLNMNKDWEDIKNENTE